MTLRGTCAAPRKSNMADGIFRDSFFFAEVLKYLYLTFDEPDAWSIDEVRYRSFSSASALSDKRCTVHLQH